MRQGRARRPIDMAPGALQTIWNKVRNTGVFSRKLSFNSKTPTITDTHGEGGVAVDFGLIIRKGLMLELEERPRQWRDRSFCPIDHLSEGSNRRWTIAEHSFFPQGQTVSLCTTRGQQE